MRNYFLHDYAWFFKCCLSTFKSINKPFKTICLDSAFAILNHFVKNDHKRTVHMKIVIFTKRCNICFVTQQTTQNDVLEPSGCHFGQFRQILAQMCSFYENCTFKKNVKFAL